MSNSDLHNNDPLPNAILGSGYGRIKGNQHLKYPQDTPHANLLLTLLDRAGVPATELGNSTGRSPKSDADDDALPPWLRATAAGRRPRRRCCCTARGSLQAREAAAHLAAQPLGRSLR